MEDNFFENGLSSDDFTLTLKGDALIDFYVHPENFELKNILGINNDIDMPENVFVSLPHGSYDLPNGAKAKLIGFNENNSEDEKKSIIRLLKNFSDFGTTDIVKYLNIKEEQVIRAKYSRAIGDCNRDFNDSSDAGYIKSHDFNGLDLFSDKKGFYELGINHYKTFHSEIDSKLENFEKNGKSSILLDLHDTGTILLGHNENDDKLRL